MLGQSEIFLGKGVTGHHINAQRAHNSLSDGDGNQEQRHRAPPSHQVVHRFEERVVLSVGDGEWLPVLDQTGHAWVSFDGNGLVQGAWPAWLTIFGNHFGNRSLGVEQSESSLGSPKEVGQFGANAFHRLLQIVGQGRCGDDFAEQRDLTNTALVFGVQEGLSNEVGQVVDEVNLLRPPITRSPPMFAAQHAHNAASHANGRVNGSPNAEHVPIGGAQLRCARVPRHVLSGHHAARFEGLPVTGVGLQIQTGSRGRNLVTIERPQAFQRPAIFQQAPDRDAGNA